MNYNYEVAGDFEFFDEFEAVLGNEASSESPLDLDTPTTPPPSSLPTPESPVVLNTDHDKSAHREDAEILSGDESKISMKTESTADTQLEVAQTHEVNGTKNAETEQNFIDDLSDSTFHTVETSPIVDLSENIMNDFEDILQKSFPFSVKENQNCPMRQVSAYLVIK